MIITIAFSLQLVLLIVLTTRLLRSSAKKDFLILPLLAATGLLLLAGFLVRSFHIQFAALTNTYEALTFFSLCITFVLAIYRLIKKNKLPDSICFGGVFISIVFLALASSPIAPSDIRPPVPALQSYWLVLHVALSFTGEAFFVIAFVASLLFLTTRDPAKRKELDRITYTSIAIGYPVYTVGALIFGAIWASYAWGRFWSWDPKETWALVTALVYTAYLHGRFVFKKRGTVLAWISVVGFAFTLFTFFGVNFLLSGLHSYR